MLGGAHRFPNAALIQRDKYCKELRESNRALQAPGLLQSARKTTRIAADDTRGDRQAILLGTTPEKSTAMRIWAVSDVHADYKENMEW
jgi:hypothetical protein